MTAKRVPSKIVIAGNSKMSLNDRFSSIPKPRPRGAVLKAQHRAPAKMRGVYPKQAIYEYVDTQNAQQFEYEPRPIVRRPRQAFQHRAVPFQSRVTFVNTAPPVQRFHQRNNFVQQSQQFQNGFKKPFRANFNQHNQNRQKFFNKQTRFPINSRGGGFPQRRTFDVVPKKKSLAELDRELDDYMRKPKHTPITI